MIQLIPKLSTVGIRTTICGPESFTPDHRPIMGMKKYLYIYIYYTFYFLF